MRPHVLRLRGHETPLHTHPTGHDGEGRLDHLPGRMRASHARWGGNTAQPLWKTARQFLTKLNVRPSPGQPARCQAHSPDGGGGGGGA